MKISVLHVSTPLSWRGGERQLFLLVSELQTGQVEQSVLCPKGSELSKQLRTYIPEVKVVEALKKRGGFDPGFARELFHTCKSEGIDLIHAHDSHAHTAAVLAADLYRNDVPVVVSRRVDFPVASSLVSRYKYRHRSVKALICVSKAIEGIVRQSLSKAKALITTVHSGVDLEQFASVETADLREEFQIPSDHAVVVNTAALEDHKDYPTFIRTIARLKERRIKLRALIFGQGSLKEELQKLVADLDLEGDVHFAGYRHDILPVLKGADVMLFPSKMEGLGTAVLDAFGVGTPVVATRAGGIAEMVEDGKSGLLCDVGDDRALADAVNIILTDPSRREALVDGAREKLPLFSSKGTAKKTEEIYGSIVFKNN